MRTVSDYAPSIPIAFYSLYYRRLWYSRPEGVLAFLHRSYGSNTFSTQYFTDTLVIPNVSQIYHDTYYLGISKLHSNTNCGGK